MGAIKRIAVVGLVAYAMCRGYDPQRAERMLKDQMMHPRQYISMPAEGESLYNAGDIVFAELDVDKDGEIEHYRIFVNEHGAVAYRSPQPMYEHVAKGAEEYDDLEEKLHERYPGKKLY